MDPLSNSSDSLRVPRVYRDPRSRQQRGGGSDFESEFERQRRSPPSDDATADGPQTAPGLQSEPAKRRRSPPDGEFHINVLA